MGGIQGGGTGGGGTGGGTGGGYRGGGGYRQDNISCPYQTLHHQLDLFKGIYSFSCRQKEEGVARKEERGQ